MLKNSFFVIIKAGRLHFIGGRMRGINGDLFYGELLTAQLQCLRPTLYFGPDFTLDIIFSYLDGYYEALLVSHLPPSSEFREMPDTEWDSFKKWLSENNISLAEIKRRYPDQNEAVKFLSKTLAEFCDLWNIPTKTVN